MNFRAWLYRRYQRLATTGLDHAALGISDFTAERGDAYWKALREHASLHVPYYATTLSRPLSEIPPLTKAAIQAHFRELQSDDMDSRRCIFNSSGGSTGQPVTLIQDAAFRAWNTATQEFFLEQMLALPSGSVPTIVLWGSERDLFGEREGLKPHLRNWLLRTTYLNSFRMTDDDLRRYVRIINERKPVLLKGYAGSLYQLAKFVKQRGLVVHRPQVIYSAAETLRPYMRQLMEEVFQSRIHDFYGSREVGAMAGECSRGRFHMFSFNNRLEVVDSHNRPVQSGQEGRVLVTTLHNYAMPLIRYEIGDTAMLGEPCGCDLKLPTLMRITGRVTDHFVTRSGALVHGEYFTHLFYYRDWVKELQLLQPDPDTVEIYFLRRADVPEAEVAEINTKIRLVMGADCRIEWHEVPEIPRTPHGKFLFTRSLVERTPAEAGETDEP